MKIVENWPAAIDLINNEFKTLDILRSNATLTATQGRLVSDAHANFLRYKNKTEIWKSFSFSSWLEFPESDVVKKAFVECLISSGNKEDYDMLTYTFGLCGLNENGEYCILRKFHIDFTNEPDTGRSPLHPVFHIQYPGSLSQTIKDVGLSVDHLLPELSEPRIYSAPTTLALLTDFLLREFGGDQISPLRRITRDDVWFRLLEKDEELVLRPYYKACNQFFHDRGIKKEPEKLLLFSQDFLYGQESRHN